MSRPPVIALRAVTVCAGRVPLLRDLDLDIVAGSLTAIVGANGAGKTTLLETLAGVRRPLSGRVETDLAPARIALLRQQGGLNREVPCTVGEFVALGVWHRAGALRRLDAAGRDRADAVMRRLGLAPLARRRLGDLSPGELQRARFAQLMMRDARLLLLDEPFAALDAAIVALLIELLHGWHREGRTIVTVLHDLSLARAAFEDVLHMDSGALVAAGPDVRPRGDAWRSPVMQAARA